MRWQRSVSAQLSPEPGSFCSYSLSLLLKSFWLFISWELSWAQRPHFLVGLYTPGRPKDRVYHWNECAAPPQYHLWMEPMHAYMPMMRGVCNILTILKHIHLTLGSPWELIKHLNSYFTFDPYHRSRRWACPEWGSARPKWSGYYPCLRTKECRPSPVMHLWVRCQDLPSHQHSFSCRQCPEGHSELSKTTERGKEQCLG